MIRLMTSEVKLSEKIKCKMCGSEVDYHKDHKHVIDIHFE